MDRDHTWIKSYNYTLLWNCASTACVSARACREREREREIGACMVHSGKNFRLSILGCTCLSLPPCLVLQSVCPRNTISSSQNRNTASHRCFCLQAASCCLKLSFVWAVWWAGSYMHWQGWTEMGHIFYPEKVGQLFSYHYISGKLGHIYPEKQQDNSEDGPMAQWPKTHGEDGARRRNVG